MDNSIDVLKKICEKKYPKGTQFICLSTGNKHVSGGEFVALNNDTLINIYNNEYEGWVYHKNLYALTLGELKEKLEEAKNKYPKGTKYKCLNSHENCISSGNLIIEDGLIIDNLNVIYNPSENEWAKRKEMTGQELVNECKNLYPIGTKFMCATGESRDILTVVESDYALFHYSDAIVCSQKNRCLHYNGKWATIISKPSYAPKKTLVDQAVEKGFVKGAKFIDLVKKATFTISSTPKNDAYNKNNELYIAVEKHPDYSNKTARAYKDGTWAQLVTSSSKPVSKIGYFTKYDTCTTKTGKRIIIKEVHDDYYECRILNPDGKQGLPVTIYDDNDLTLNKTSYNARIKTKFKVGDACIIKERGVFYDYKCTIAKVLDKGGYQIEFIDNWGKPSGTSILEANLAFDTSKGDDLEEQAKKKYPKGTYYECLRSKKTRVIDDIEGIYEDDGSIYFDEDDELKDGEIRLLYQKGVWAKIFPQETQKFRLGDKVISLDDRKARIGRSYTVSNVKVLGYTFLYTFKHDWEKDQVTCTMGGENFELMVDKTKTKSKCKFKKGDIAYLLSFDKKNYSPSFVNIDDVDDLNIYYSYSNRDNPYFGGSRNAVGYNYEYIITEKEICSYTAFKVGDIVVYEHLRYDSTTFKICELQGDKIVLAPLIAKLYPRMEYDNSAKVLAPANKIRMHKLLNKTIDSTPKFKVGDKVLHLNKAEYTIVDTYLRSDNVRFYELSNAKEPKRIIYGFGALKVPENELSLVTPKKEPICKFKVGDLVEYCGQPETKYTGIPYNISSMIYEDDMWKFLLTNDEIKNLAKYQNINYELLVVGEEKLKLVNNNITNSECKFKVGDYVYAKYGGEYDKLRGKSLIIDKIGLVYGAWEFYLKENNEYSSNREHYVLGEENLVYDTELNKSVNNTDELVFLPKTSKSKVITVLPEEELIFIPENNEVKKLSVIEI